MLHYCNNFDNWEMDGLMKSAKVLFGPNLLLKFFRCILFWRSVLALHRSSFWRQLIIKDQIRWLRRRVLRHLLATTVTKQLSTLSLLVISVLTVTDNCWRLKGVATKSTVAESYTVKFSLFRSSLTALARELRTKQEIWQWARRPQWHHWYFPFWYVPFCRR